MILAVTIYSLEELQPGWPSLKDATEGAKEFEKLVLIANTNVAVCPLYSNNIHSSDDGAICFVSGINDQKECEWKIARYQGENNNVRSRYSTKQNQYYLAKQQG